MTFEEWMRRVKYKQPRYDLARKAWLAGRRELKKEILAELDYDATCQDVCPDQCYWLKLTKEVIEELEV